MTDCHVAILTFTTVLVLGAPKMYFMSALHPIMSNAFMASALAGVVLVRPLHFPMTRVSPISLSGTTRADSPTAASCSFGRHEESLQPLSSVFHCPSFAS